jgi:hypothetical protein
MRSAHEIHLLEGAFPEDSLSQSLARLAGWDSFQLLFWFVSMYTSKTAGLLSLPGGG